jgi:hypothetical protein
MDWSLLLVIGLLAAAAVALIFVTRAAERRREEELRSVAPMLGFSLEVESRKLAESRLDSALLAFPLFRHSGSPRVRCVMRASRLAGEDAVFDFRYTVSTGKSSHTVEQTVAAFRRRGAGLPVFRLHPENLFDKLGQAFGGQDIDFESNEEFSKRYVLTGEDPDAVRALFERQAVMYFADHPGWSVEGGGEWLIVFRSSKREKPNDLRTWLDEVRQAARALGHR